MKAKKDRNPIGGMNNTEHHTFSFGFLWLLHAALNFALLATVAVFGFLAFFASLEIVLTLGAPAIAQTIESAVRAKYTLVTLRNIWLLVGGILLLVVIIYCINYFFKHWHDMRVHRVFLVILALEAVIIVVQYALTA